MTKGLSRKQIIILMGLNNVERVITQSNTHIANINRWFKNIKSKTLVNFIYSDNKRIVVTTHKVATSLDFNIVEKYIKKLNNVDLSNIMSLRLP